MNLRSLRPKVRLNAGWESRRGDVMALAVMTEASAMAPAAICLTGFPG
jgi:hypothetical protein